MEHDYNNTHKSQGKTRFVSTRPIPQYTVKNYGALTLLLKIRKKEIKIIKWISITVHGYNKQLTTKILQFLDMQESQIKILHKNQILFS